MDLKFCEKTHTYTHKEYGIIPSVTTILKKVGLSPSFGGISPFYAQRGTALHETIYYYNVNNELPPIIPEMIKEHTGRYLEFYSDHSDYESLEQERMGFYNKNGIMYCGTADDICMINGEKAIIDYKTSSQIRKYHYFQLDAYCEMFNVKNAYVLQIREDFYRLKEVPQKYRGKFLDICDIYYNDLLSIEDKIEICKKI